MSQSKSARRTLTAAVAPPAPVAPAVIRVTKLALSDELAAIRRKLAASENAVESWKVTAERSGRLYHASQALTACQASRIADLSAAMFLAKYQAEESEALMQAVRRREVKALVFAVLAGAAAALAAVYAPLSAVLS